MTLSGFESVQATNDASECITDMKFNVETTKHPNHLFDTPPGWHYDPALRVECFEEQECCPTLELSSNSYGATFFPHLMGSYLISPDYRVSGRRVYRRACQSAVNVADPKPADWGESQIGRP